ncbi:MAG TPA: oligosaccharide flippase family protein [Sphingomicrobium sp.]|nr:oligosaccharide flippase family protein [Sphingomicrobium sp.]
MTGDASSYRRILWATSVIGGATLAALLIGLARNKAVALIGGPAAIGLFGLFTTIISMGASVAALGLDTSAVRQLAQRRDDTAEVERTQRAVWTMAWPLAITGAAAVFLFRRPIAAFAAGSSVYADTVGWLSIGVAASVVAAAQLAILQGHGRIGDLARVRLWGSLVATIAAIYAVYRFGTLGIAIAGISIPLVTAVVGFWYGRALPRSNWRQLADGSLAGQWRALATIGIVVMSTNALVTLNDLSVRAVVSNRLGLEPLGLFVASSAIVWVNLSLVLNAMAADYYPRLSSVAHDARAMSTILNQQLHVALGLAAPALIAVSAGAPVVLAILYSPAFAESAFVLRLLVAAGVLRLGTWALGFALLARRASGSYMLAEIAAAAAIPLAWFLLPRTGLWGVGLALILSAAASFGVYLWRTNRGHGIVMDRQNLVMIAALVAFLSALAVITEAHATAGMVIGAVAALALGWRAFRQFGSAIRG